MKNIYLVVIFTLIGILSFSQNVEPKLNTAKGYRIKKGTEVVPIYKEKNGEIEFQDWRKLSNRVYFKLVKLPCKRKDNKTYQMITIPGISKELEQGELEAYNRGEFPRSGTSINSKDYDQNFWIDSALIVSESEPELYKYQNDAFSGVLTAPFKLRLKTGSATESMADGSFNVSPFFGWKFRLSTKKPVFISPFIFTGVTTINYSSSTNSGIIDPNRKETGAGITYGGGIAFRIGSISPGIIVGFDHGFGSLGRTFIYNDKIWISFSLNFEFFKPKENEKTSTVKNKKI